MRIVLFLVALALAGGVAWWAVTSQKPPERDPATGQVQSGAAVQTGGMDPDTALQGARGATVRIEGEGFQRAAEVDEKTAP